MWNEYEKGDASRCMASGQSLIDEVTPIVIRRKHQSNVIASFIRAGIPFPKVNEYCATKGEFDVSKEYFRSWRLQRERLFSVRRERKAEAR